MAWRRLRWVVLRRHRTGRGRKERCASCSYLPADFCSERNSGRERPLHDPPQLARLVVGCLPSPRKHYIVIGRRAALENELRLSSGFVVDGAEVVGGKRHNKLSLPHDTPNFRSPPIHWQ